MTFQTSDLDDTDLPRIEIIENGTVLGQPDEFEYTRSVSSPTVDGTITAKSTASLVTDLNRLYIGQDFFDIRVTYKYNGNPDDVRQATVVDAHIPNRVSTTVHIDGMPTTEYEFEAPRVDHDPDP